MSQWNTLSVPLGSSWQCTLVLAGEYVSPSGNTVRLMRDDDESGSLRKTGKTLTGTFGHAGT
jgi:hypothetical protein